jgi:long-chain fatty acid transport protein
MELVMGKRLKGLVNSLIFLSVCTASNFTHAGLGSYLNGAGTNNRARSGAGVAFAEDAMVIATNPAGAVQLKKDQWLVGSIFLTAKQTANASEVNPATAPPGAFALAPGKREAEPDVPAEIDGIFPIPFGAITQRLDAKNAIGLAIYGNGGININYKAFDNPGCPPGTPAQGYLCFGDAGSDIAQIFIAPTWSHQVNDRLSIGISPELIYQTIELNGYQLFAPASARPDKLSNNGHSSSFGYGLKLGANLQASDSLSLGLSLQSRGYMQKHKEYAGLLAEQGDLDIAPFIQFGLAWQATNKLHFLVDFQRIYFSNINAYGNAGNAPGRYGDDNGPGFGWSDLSVIKLGVHYQYNNRLTLRLGMSDVIREPVSQQQVLNNLNTTPVFDQRINAGVSWVLDKKNTLDLAINYIPKQDITGENPQFPGQEITLSNQLFSVDIGWRRAF